jgi:transcriptional regulator with XRE-family HTH domain
MRVEGSNGLRHHTVRSHGVIDWKAIRPLVRASATGIRIMTLDRQEVRKIVKRVFARQDVIEACKRHERHDIGLIISVLGSHGISQGLIAGLTGIPQGRLSEYKTGKRHPTLDTLAVFADGLDVPEHARRALGLAPATAGDGAALSTVDATAGQMAMPDLLTVAWMAGSLNNHVDRRAVLQLAATLLAAPILGVEEPMERLAYALTGPTALQDDTVAFLEQRTVGLHRIEPMFQARLVHRSIMDHLREVTALLEGHPRDPLRPRLARVAGESAVLAGFCPHSPCSIDPCSDWREPLTWVSATPLKSSSEEKLDGRRGPYVHFLSDTQQGQIPVSTVAGRRESLRACVVSRHRN